MTKAERIYRATRMDCKDNIRRFGYKRGVGFTGMTTKDNELVYQRTANEIKRLIAKEERDLMLDAELEIISKEEYNFEKQVISMVKETLKNQYIA